MKNASDSEPTLPDWNDLTDEELAAWPCEESTRPRRRQYLRGPIDWPDTCIVARLPGKALEIWLLLHLRWPLAGVAGVTLPDRRLAEMGVDRWAKNRALRTLEGAGLIHVRHQRGCAARITLTRGAER